MQEYYVAAHSKIHQLDARVKIIFTLAFIIFLNLTPSKAWPAYILFFTLILSITILSRVGVGFVLKRSLLAAPFVLAALPLIFTLRPLVTVPVFQGFQVSYSPEGLGRFVSIGIKSWISIQAAILLTAAARFPDLLTGFRQLKVPKLFVAIIGLMWRYLFIISEEVVHMMRARTSRSAQVSGSHRTGGSILWRARVTGGMAGSLFLRSLERSDRVYAAMLSRGYNGDLPDRPDTALARNDLLVLLIGLAMVVFLTALSGIQ